MSARPVMLALARPTAPLISRATRSGPSTQQSRGILTQRATSFWAPSYPAPEKNHKIEETPMPPLPEARGGLIPETASSSSTKSHRRDRYLDSLMDKAGHMYLKCSILDANGNWTAEEGTYRKMDLCRAHDLDPRDLRKLDSLVPSLVPIILTRRSCILISIQHIRALIKPDRVIIFNTPGAEDSEAAKRFKAHLQANVRSGLAPKHEERVDGEDYGLPYEHRALESILVDTANALEEEMGFIRRLVDSLLERFEHDIDRENLRRLLHYSRRLAGFQTRAKSIKSSFDELLDSDEDLAAMYVGDRMHGRPRAVHDHEQLELLLEGFTKQVEEVVSEIDTTAANMQSTQEVAELMLDSGRNELLALDIKVSMATLGIGAGALIPCLFGMNLTTHLESTEYVFLAASGASMSLALLLYLYGVRVLRKVRHVSLVSMPTSLPQSVREAKERFVRERAESWRWHEAQAEAECGAKSSTMYAKGIPDYEARWGAVRRSLRSRASIWDRLFRPHLLHRNLLGLKRAPVLKIRAVVHPKKDAAAGQSPVPGGAGAVPAAGSHGATHPIPSTNTHPPSPMASPTRPTAPRTMSAPLARVFTTSPASQKEVGILPDKDSLPSLKAHPPLPKAVPVTVTPPSLAAIQEEGYYDDDVTLLPEDEAMLRLTPSAAAQLAKIGEGEKPGSQLAFRVGVDSGGCHGYQYKMELTEERGGDDYVFSAGSIPVVVDLASLRLLKNATLDYATELIGSSFRIAHNPQAKDGGNCGCGVSWELEGQL
ncbi:hypothetical protein CcaverHIS002_0210370 [Cutaneotrichosporon cavernicola]|uniref:Uncharacterized protein n=1 Tax=Cutaneotrichosporon cavernicola TaxID=279322 RepID=A0AA48L1X1_9TREE|nr:uncharacterized protein CcaverHIS019_0210390 [Cutaneotrichosporon cavernicola]BEI81877.1 hypothetical protein CcaverHIS002_0210370 [Cutaneotrichosporon cavernicola]BEI89677.1 hypothetical protein CcaverHIS019_0210390 [Cutaneotrichosporon cavernicola]BEI97448.1 hypothetical protein CcaverHIS631_0210370 [Cutaneotrichosporon cavernicola]BEJ05226.1 hypothetical protein CcaverHIS641_0210430 [Cutaneotrichosporon cavernicola]